MNNTQTWLFRLPLAVIIFVFAAYGCVGCEDGISSGDCDSDEVWDSDAEECIPDLTQIDAGSSDAIGGGNGGAGDGGQTTGDGGGGTEPPCVNLACDQVECPDGQTTTSLSGNVTIPSGELPLPNVSVYVPNSELGPIAQGASCERCEDMVTGDPLVHTTTNPRGNFYLEDVPVTDNLPLVIQTGKWRRKVEISTVEECTENQVDPDKTRLPRNRSEGEIPSIAVTTGNCDALECLLLDIGLDDEEFSTDVGNGAVHLFTGSSGSTGWASYPTGTNSFDHSFSSETRNFSDGTTYWNDLDNMLQYDMMLHSCECNPYADQKSQQARDALQAYAYEGGRVFLSHWHNTWLEDGPADFRSVADWRSDNSVGFNTVTTAYIDESFAAGSRMYEWMDYVDGLNATDGVDIHEGRITVQSINPTLAERWLYIPYQGTDWDHYFAFNTPVGAAEEQECGRVVFSDLHVAAGNQSSPSHPFPTGCIGTELSGQEKALIYMLFDLSACITDCVPLRCEDITGACGLEPDGCGSHIECDECCVEEDEPCEVDDDCCHSLWCDDDTGLCTDRCRDPGERCDQNSDCCSNVCDATAGDEGECIEL